MISLLRCLTEGGRWDEGEALLLRFTMLCATSSVPTAEKHGAGHVAGVQRQRQAFYHHFIQRISMVQGQDMLLHEQAISKVREYVNFTQRY
jgi:hypothetical protein